MIYEEEIHRLSSGNFLRLLLLCKTGSWNTCNRVWCGFGALEGQSSRAKFADWLETWKFSMLKLGLKSDFYQPHTLWSSFEDCWIKTSWISSHFAERWLVNFSQMAFYWELSWHLPLQGQLKVSPIFLLCDKQTIWVDKDWAGHFSARSFLVSWLGHWRIN